jgi:hypothetical protein
MDVTRDPDEVMGEIEMTYRRRYPAFLRVAVAITGDEQLGADAVQDAFVGILRGRRGIRTPSAACLPVAVRESALLEELERVGGARVGGQPHARHHMERSERPQLLPSEPASAYPGGALIARLRGYVVSCSAASESAPACPASLPAPA